MNPDTDKIFCAGIGGMGMAPLAIYLAKRGIQVSGGDDALSERVAQCLQCAGIALTKELPADCTTVVYSSAIPHEHGWRRSAIERGITPQRRGDFLSQLSQSRKLLAIAGSHGKTSTTAMLIDLCQQAGVPCDYILGGLFANGNLAPADARPEAEWLIAELDESDGTIERFSPEATVLVNCDWDHPDHYPTAQSLRDAFSRLLQRTRSTIILPAHECTYLTDGGVQAHRVAVTLPPPPSGFAKANETLARAAFSVMAPGPQPATVNGQVFRRQEVLIDRPGLRVVSDYAHHPAEIEAMLAGGQPDIIAFQPHRYSRTRHFAEQFRAVLRAAKEVLLLPVYAASETEDPQGTSHAIAKGTPWPVYGFAEASASLGERLRTASAEHPLELWALGAGDIDAWARGLVSDLQSAQELAAKLSEEAVVRIAEPLGPKTTLRVGGNARWYAEPANPEDLRALWAWAQSRQVPMLCLGRGSNLIVADEGFDGLAVAFRQPAWRSIEPLGNGRFHVGCGTRLKELCAAAAKAGWAGFEFLEGIPGAVGGSLRMNAGAMGGWIFDRVESVCVMHPDGHRESLPLSHFHTGYRSCPELEPLVVLSAVFAGSKPDAPDAIRERMRRLADQRKASQPREPSAGCLFKNPEGGHAGAWIDQAGLKGTRQGGAEVSSVHANFLINRNQATAADVLTLAREIRKRIARERGTWLQPEPLLIGAEWQEIFADD